MVVSPWARVYSSAQRAHVRRRLRPARLPPAGIHLVWALRRRRGAAPRAPDGAPASRSGRRRERSCQRSARVLSPQRETRLNTMSGLAWASSASAIVVGSFPGSFVDFIRRERAHASRSPTMSCGLTACPADAVAEVRAAMHFVASHGGRGAARELIGCCAPPAAGSTVTSSRRSRTRHARRLRRCSSR